jgi:uncharacterized protein
LTHDHYDDDDIRAILRSVKTIAMVGVSANDARPSYFVFKYLLSRGFHMIGVNPGLAGGTLLGQPVYGRLAEIPEPVDMIDIFRNSEAAGAVVDEALLLSPLPQVIWMQLTVRNDAAAAKAEAHGIKVVMNRCPKIEYGRISGEIGWTGVTSRIISSKRPQSAKGFQRLTLDRT